jgi:lipoprotein-anchoring transpeptidase ErfK/SrfK
VLYRRTTALIGILLGVLVVAAFSAVEDDTTVVAAASPRSQVVEDPSSTTAVGPTVAATIATDDVGEEPEAAPAAAPDVAVPVAVDATVLPEDSGTGRRIVYANKAQRVWVVDENGQVLRTFLVSGRKWVPGPGTYKVFGKAEKSRSKFFPEITMDHMVRFAISPNKVNTIGFHAIPYKNGKPMQTEAQLGTHLSGGCVRLAPADATWLFNWANIGTKVVVLA